MSIDFVMTRVAVVEMRSRLCSKVRITESRREVNRTLSDEWNSIEMRSFPVVEAVPVQRRRRSSHMIRHINNDQIILADVNSWTRNLSVDRHDSSLHSIGGDTL